MVAAPMKTTTAPEICNTIMDHFMGYFGTPTCHTYVNGFYTHMVYMSPQPAPQITSLLWLNMALKV